MTPAPVPHRLFSRALREALEGSLSAERASGVIASALDRAGLPEVPEDLELFEHFVRRALHATLVGAMGTTIADVCIERLSHVLWMASSTVRAHAPSADSFAQVLQGATEESREEPSGMRAVETPPAPRRAPTIGRMTPVQARPASVREVQAVPSAQRGVVLVITLDGTLLREVEKIVEGRRAARHVGSPAELVNVLSTERELAPTILVDTALPSVELATFANLASLLPSGTRVVLWGMEPRQKKRLVSVFPQAADWIAGGDAASPAELLIDRHD